MSRALETIANLGKVILIWGVIIFGVPYIGGCVYSNWFADRATSIDVPTIEQAPYAIVMPTGVVLYARQATSAGGTITLEGWYELRDRKYREHEETFTLDRKYFGNIRVITRE